MRNSAFEHQIPEQLFSTSTQPAEGVSTAKAFAVAMAQGQRIYTLTQTNAAQLANITIDEGSRVEIQTALNQGFEITVHQNPITVNGWTGSGYSILDPEYGVGAYKISGGGSGSFLQFAFMIALFAIVIGLGVAAFSSGGLLAAIWGAYNFDSWLDSIKKAQNYRDFNQANSSSAFALSLGFLGLAKFGAEGASVLIFAEAISFLLGMI